MAHTKAKGSTRLGRDSQSKRLGVKIYGGQQIHAGSIIIRQRGTKYHPGKGTKIGKDDTIYAARSGIVKFKITKIFRGSGRKMVRRYVSVVD